MHDREDEVPMNLLKIMRMLRSYQATDPRDKVYAALNLASDQQVGKIRIDYSPMNSPEDVYVDVAKYFLEEYKTLDWMDPVAFRCLHDLPSGVPDWSINNWLGPLEKYKRFGNETSGSFYCAAGRYTVLYDEQGNVKAPGVVHGTKLHLQGVLIDRIESVGDAVREHGLEMQLSWYQLITDASSPYPFTGESKQEAFQRILTGDTMIATNGDPIRHPDLNLCLPIDFGHKPIRIANPLPITPPHNPYGQIFLASSMTGKRQFAVTRSGYMGLVPDGARAGDWVCMLLGGKVLYVLREAESNQYRMAGECYMHGLMDGQSLDMLRSGGVRKIIVL